MDLLQAQAVIDTIVGAGMQVCLTADMGLNVSPASKISPTSRELIRANKDSLVDFLLIEAAKHRVLAPDEITKEEWLFLDAAYQEHHFKCPQCIAAGLGRKYGLRCGLGAALWRSCQVPIADEKFQRSMRGSSQL